MGREGDDYESVYMGFCAPDKFTTEGNKNIKSWGATFHVTELDAAESLLAALAPGLVVDVRTDGKGWWLRVSERPKVAPPGYQWRLCLLPVEVDGDE